MNKSFLSRSISTALIALAATSASFVQAQDIIKNGTFNNGYTPWEVPGWWTDGDGTFEVDNQQRFCVTTTALGTEVWGAQLRQSGLTYVEGETYDISLKAWSSVPMSIDVSGSDESGDYTWIFGKTLDIDSSLSGNGQDISFSLVAAADSDEEGKFAFLLGAGAVPVNQTVCFDDIVVDGPELAEKVDTTVQIRINQIGYLPDSPKKAAYKLADNATNFSTSRTWSLIKGNDIVATGKTTPHGNGIDAASGDLVHSIDFSAYDIEGEGYTLAITDGNATHTSNTFPISTTIYDQVKYDALSYFYHNRSGIEVEADVVGQAWSRPAGHNDDVSVETLSCLSDSNANDCTTVNSYGGWYDAGDHGKYVVNGGISLWTLFNQYERFKLLGKGTANFDDGTMALPVNETSNGIPDLLDEAAWQMDWFFNMQVAEGQPLAGMVYHKMHDENWTGFPLAPHEDTQDRYVHPPSTAATLNFAAVGAQCYRVFKEFDTAYAEKCLTQAKVAYAAALKNPNVYASEEPTVGGGLYDDNNVTDEFYWAATELYVATGDESYADDMKTSSLHNSTPTSMTWQATYPLGVISLATVGTINAQADSLTASARQSLITAADGYVQNANSEGYGLPFSAVKYPWGSNSSVVNNMIVLGLAYDFTAKDDYVNAMLQGANYLFGHNAMSHSYVTGYGTTYEQYPHHRFWAEVLDSDYPPAPAGALSGGPNSSLQDSYASARLLGCSPQKCFVDNIDAWSVNEITINWNAPFSWVTAYLDEYATNGSDVSEPVTSEPVTSEPVTSEPVTSEPVTSEPVTSEPVTSEPVTSEPVTSEPVTSEPVTSEPVTSEPVTSEPVTSEPVTSEPVTSEPVTSEPVTSEPVTSEPVTSEPVTSEPVTSEPVTSEPVTSEPVTSEPVTSEPVTSEPVTSEPVTSEPVTSEPVTSEPVTSEPVTSEPVTSEPVTSEPVTSEPVTSEPVTSEPVTSEPVTSEPVTSEPVTSEPVTSEPVTSEPTIPTNEKCEFTYNIVTEWNAGYIGKVSVKNNSGAAITKWEVTMSYSDGSKISNAWSSTLTGGNEVYTASNAPWNGSIQNNASVNFGMQLSKSVASAVKPTLSGTCE